VLGQRGDSRVGRGDLLVQRLQEHEQRPELGPERERQLHGGEPREEATARTGRHGAHRADRST
jgi:hypothetical protein